MFFMPLFIAGLESKWVPYLLWTKYLRDEIDDLVQQESQYPYRETDEPHHEPSVPVEPRRLLLKPVAVHLAVRAQVLEALV